MESWPLFEEEEATGDIPDDISADSFNSEEEDLNNNLYTKSKGTVIRKKQSS